MQNDNSRTRVNLSLLLLLMSPMAVFCQDDGRTVVRTISPGSIPRVVPLQQGGELGQRAAALVQRSMARSRTAAPLAAAETDSVLAVESPSGLLLAAPVRQADGQPLRKNPDGTATAAFAIIGEDRRLDVELTGDGSIEQLSRLVISDADTGQGLDFDLAGGTLYSIGASAAASGASGTVGCVLGQLGDLAKPCNLTLLAGTGAGCIAAIAALPATSGVSAIIALPVCGAFLESITQTLACAGYDCAFKSALDAANALHVTWNLSPPATVTSGQTVPLGWQVSTLNPLGNPLTSMRVIGSTSANPVSNPMFTMPVSAGGMITPMTASYFIVNMPLPQSSYVAGTKLYFEIEAVSGATKYYSSILSSTVASLPTPTPSPNPSTTSFSGSVSVGSWWQQTVNVPAGRSLLKVQAGWSGNADLDLHLYTPAGQHYGYTGIMSGYSGYAANPEWIQINAPAAGPYTVKLYGFSGPSGSTSFTGSIFIQ